MSRRVREDGSETDMRGDLHCHTTFSDGSEPPEELAEYAKRAGLGCIAVTDHDTMDGAPAAAKRGAQLGVKVIPGIEVSTWDGIHSRKAHLLCYMPDKPEALLELCAGTLRRRDELAQKIVDAISGKYPVDIGAVRRRAGESRAMYKQHVILALADMGYTVSVFGELSRSIFGEGGPCAGMRTEYPDTREAISLMREAGGVSVLAHPGLYGNFDLLEELCAMGLEGIEVCHPKQSAQDEAIAWEAADRYGLIATGGSDFHGMYAERPIPLGTCTAPEDQLEALLKLRG